MLFDLRTQLLVLIAQSRILPKLLLVVSNRHHSNNILLFDCLFVRVLRGLCHFHVGMAIDLEKAHAFSQVVNLIHSCNVSISLAALPFVSRMKKLKQDEPLYLTLEHRVLHGSKKKISEFILSVVTFGR